MKLMLRLGQESMKEVAITMTINIIHKWMNWLSSEMLIWWYENRPNVKPKREIKKQKQKQKPVALWTGRIFEPMMEQIGR